MSRRPILMLCVIALVYSSSVSAVAKPERDVDLSIAAEYQKVVPTGGGFTLELKVGNHGSETARGAQLNLYLPPELYLERVQGAGACEFLDYSQYDDDTPPPSGEGGGSTTSPAPARHGEIVCTFGAVDAGGSRTVSVDLTRVSGWPVYTSAWVSAEDADAAPDDNYADVTLDADPNTQADLSLTRTVGALPKADETFTYALLIHNRGPADATDITLNDYFGDGLNYVSHQVGSDRLACRFESYPPPYADASQKPGSGAEPQAPPHDGARTEEGAAPDGGSTYYSGYQGFVCTIGSLASGESASVDVTLRRATAREIYGSAAVGTSSYDPNYENNWDNFFLDADKTNPTDLMVTERATPVAPAVGEDFSYDIEVTNLGPSAAQSSRLSAYVPWEADFVSVAPSDPADACEFHEGGGGPQPLEKDASSPIWAYREVICELGRLEPNERAVVTINLTRRSAWPIWSSAWVTSSSYDSNFENDYADAYIDADPSATADLYVRKEAPPELPAAGEQFDYTLTVGNEGPAAATEVSLADYLPPEVEFVSASSSDSQDQCSLDIGPAPGPEYEERPEPAPGGAPSGFNCALGTVVAGEETTIVLTVRRVDQSAVYNSAWVSSETTYDPDWSDNSSDVCSDGDASSGGGSVEKGERDDRVVVQTCGNAREIDVDTSKGADTIEVHVDRTDAALQEIRVNGGAGRDVIRIVLGPDSPSVPIVVVGGRGADDIEIVADGSVGPLIRLRGRHGDDVLRGSALSEFLFGGRGKDLLVGGAGDDSLDGGPGRDRCDGGPGADSVARCR